MPRQVIVVLSFLLLVTPVEAQHESLWLEAEHFHGIKGYCWPMGKPDMKKTEGHWGLSGPGWAAEWNQGGESGFLSIACGADDDKAVVTRDVEIPVDGQYFVWVRYGDWREKTERFQVRIEQPGQAAWSGQYGEKPMIEEDNEMKLYWGWTFAWAAHATQLKKGPCRISLVSTTKEPVSRQIDAVVLTTDPTYRPHVKERPRRAGWDVLDGYRSGIPADLEPLARRRPDFQNIPTAWKVKTLQDKGLLYLWNVDTAESKDTWLSDKPDRVKAPYHLRDKDVLDEFTKKYAGKEIEIPIFGDPRIVPVFHGAGPAPFATDAKTGELNETAKRLAAWLDSHPGRCWASMMNYASDTPIGPKGREAFRKYRDRYVGAVAGESLGYFNVDAKAMQQATSQARTRRELVEAFGPLMVQANAEKYRKIYGMDVDKNSSADVISCLSVGNIAFAPLQSQWGNRTIGYESAAATSSLLSMRWAFLRGMARQGKHLTATYRSCNFGDSATIFSNTQSYHSPQNILDNYYSVYSGAGMTWYKMDLWYQYLAGASMFYHEQGFDEFWKPGGTSAAGVQEVQLSPKGKLVDRFLRVTAAHPDRGTPYAPVAFLVDYAHGWEPAPFWPNAFNNAHEQPDRFLHGDHEQMLQEYFWTAFHPIGPESQKPMTGTNEVYVPGVFGDVFDCIFAYPDVQRWMTIDTYPVVIAAGEIELTQSEGQRLAKYVQDGGTLVVADGHLSGPGLAELKLPAVGEQAESDGYRWLGDATIHPSPRYRYRPIMAPDAKIVARTSNNHAICAAFDRGQGRLIYLSVPYGMSISRQAVPLVPRLLAHLTRGLMPIEVEGQVEWLVNRTANGWLVGLFNPAGQPKPQQGIMPTDYRENRTVKIRGKAPMAWAGDWLFPDEKLTVANQTIELVVPAGGVRIVEIK